MNPVWEVDFTRERVLFLLMLFDAELAGGFKDFEIVYPEDWGNDPIWWAYVSNGLAKGWSRLKAKK